MFTTGECKHNETMWGNGFLLKSRRYLHADKLGLFNSSGLITTDTVMNELTVKLLSSKKKCRDIYITSISWSTQHTVPHLSFWTCSPGKKEIIAALHTALDELFQTHWVNISLNVTSLPQSSYKAILATRQTPINQTNFVYLIFVYKNLTDTSETQV